MHVHGVSIGRCEVEEGSEVKSGFNVDDDDDDVLFSSFCDECVALVTMTRLA